MTSNEVPSKNATPWFYIRAAGFWIIGLMNTVLARPEDVGGVKFWIGCALLVIAALDTGWFVYKRFFRR